MWLLLCLRTRRATEQQLRTAQRCNEGLAQKGAPGDGVGGRHAPYDARFLPLDFLGLF